LWENIAIILKGDHPRTILKLGSNLTSGFRGEDLTVKSLWLMTDD
jgi:hypothetical protein